MAGYQSRHNDQYNWEFVAHVVNDILQLKGHLVCFGTEPLVDLLRTSVFGIEAWGLQSERVKNKNYNSYWNCPYNDTHFGRDYADIFVSIGYSRDYDVELLDGIAYNTLMLMRDRGLLLIVDPGNWAAKFSRVFELRKDLVEEVKNYSIFADKQVYVYRK